MERTEIQTEKKALFWLSQIPGFGGRTIQKLWNHLGSFQGILFNIEETQSVLDEVLTEYQRQKLLSARENWKECEKQYSGLIERGIEFTSILEDDYPKRLREILDPPVALFIRGALPMEEVPSVAVVGARSCTSYGRQIAEEFSRILAQENVQIISGLALGIDGAAHRGAISAQKPTFGVLGCGVNICYPSSHYDLFESMVSCGGILSEYSLGEKPSPGNFPRRNRIISGLADAILVVEAKEKSGSLITVELGLEQGKEIFAVPGRVTDPYSRGCNWLIKEGATPALCPNDILEHLGIKIRKKIEIAEKNINRLAKKEKMVYSCLDLIPKHLDEITKACGLEIRECMGLLLGLELGGYVIQTANHFYGKNIQE